MQHFFPEVARLRKFWKNMQARHVVEGLRILPTLLMWGYVNTEKVFHCEKLILSNLINCEVHVPAFSVCAPPPSVSLAGIQQFALGISSPSGHTSLVPSVNQNHFTIPERLNFWSYSLPTIRGRELRPCWVKILPFLAGGNCSESSHVLNVLFTWKVNFHIEKVWYLIVRNFTLLF